MIRLGLTGSIGMGKSTTALMFRNRGIPVYDADATVHRLYENEAAQLIENLFPGTAVNGQVDREKLGEYVVGNDENMKKLAALVHPMVHAVEKKFLTAAENAGSDIVLLDIPLLFETGGKDRVDKIIVVSASAEIQRERVLARENMTIEKFEAILSKQLPDVQKRKHADYIIDTGKGFEFAEAQVDKILNELRNKSV